MKLVKFATKQYGENVRIIHWASLLNVSRWDSIFWIQQWNIETSRFR